MRLYLTLNTAAADQCGLSSGFGQLHLRTELLNTLKHRNELVGECTHVPWLHEEIDGRRIRTLLGEVLHSIIPENTPEAYRIIETAKANGEVAVESF